MTLTDYQGEDNRNPSQRNNVINELKTDAILTPNKLYKTSIIQKYIYH